MSVRARYCSRRRRRPTSSSRPRRLWWSCLCTLRCSVRSLIRRVSSATWTSGEPVSPSPVACWPIISAFTVLSSGTWLLHANRRGAARRCWGSPGPVGYWNSEGTVICCMRAQHNTAAIHRTATHGITARTLPRPSRGVRVAWLPVERAGSVGYARASGLREPAGGQCPGLVDVDAHLRHEVIDRGELDRSPQPDGEV